MLGRKKKQQKVVVVEVENIKDPAAIKIQCLVRAFIAKKRIIKVARKTWQRVFDPTYKKYFWFNHLHGTSVWEIPRHVELFETVDHQAAVQIQKVIRGFNGRMQTRKLANEKYTRYYDPTLNKFYWLDKSTQTTSWTVSPWLLRQDIAMPPEDLAQFESKLRIRELEAQLAAKDLEIKEIRRKRFEELEPEVIRDKVENAKSFHRSKNMDDWRLDELAAWFTELKMDEYIGFLFRNR